MVGLSGPLRASVSLTWGLVPFLDPGYQLQTKGGLFSQTEEWKWGVYASNMFSSGFGLPHNQGKLSKREGGEDLIKKIPFRDFPGSPVVKNPCLHGRGHGSHPWSENWDPTCHTVQPKQKKQTNNKKNQNKKERENKFKKLKILKKKRKKERKKIPSQLATSH